MRDCDVSLRAEVFSVGYSFSMKLPTCQTHVNKNRMYDEFSLIIILRFVVQIPRGPGDFLRPKTCIWGF